MVIPFPNRNKDAKDIEGNSETSGIPHAEGKHIERCGPKWRGIHAAVLALAAVHVCTVKHFQRYFASSQAAYRSVARLRKRGKLRHVGTVQLKDNGRPLDCYCNGWNPKRDHLKHEVLLTDVLLQYPYALVRRGYDVDQNIRADAEMEFAGLKMHVELDTGQMNLQRVKGRWARSYRDVSDLLLVVTAGQDKRLRNLIEVSKAVADIALFTTFDRVQSDPSGEIWIDRFNEKAALPRMDG